MDAENITSENVVSFFNTYKHNSDMIFHLERRLLNESYDFAKWEELLTANSQLTRRLFVENENLINDIFHPALLAPEKLSEETLQTFLLHITFFLFENNVDSHFTEDFINSVLKSPTQLNKRQTFDCYMNLGISRTVSVSGTFEENVSFFEKAMSVLPDFKSAPDDNTRIHQVFCRVYQMLCFDLFASNDYSLFEQIYNSTEQMIRNGNDVLYAKMWGEQADFPFHIDLLLRYMRIYGIYTAGKNNFSVSCSEQNSSGEQETSGEKNSSTKQKSFGEQEASLKTICSWLTQEFNTEEQEGVINPMIFTYFKKMQLSKNEISKTEYENALYQFHTKYSSKIDSLQKDEEKYIYPEFSFPIDDDPVSPMFAVQLDKMKLFNRSFTYAFILLLELYQTTNSTEIKKQAKKNIISYLEHYPYAHKGFFTDLFIVDLLKLLAPGMESIDEFIFFMLTIFTHRETTSSIHFSMVSALAGECFSHLVEKSPALFVTEQFPTEQSVRENRIELLQFVKKAGLLHDIGKIGQTNLINLHFRKITDREFQQIQNHTRLGYQIVDKIEYLEPFKDIIIGHHRFYDGTFGYPKEFDVLSSKLKTYIDLITICDCIDTSTDFRGRNYARKKTFDDILKELIEQQGTRYSPELVNLINQDESLKEELRYMTSDGRNYTSYKTYSKFIQPHMHFKKEDEKSVHKIDLSSFEQKERIQNFFVTTQTLKDCEKTQSTSSHRTNKDYTNKDDPNKEIPGLTKDSICFALQNEKQEIFGILLGSLNNSKDAFLIEQMFILPEHRRKGWGTELLYALSDELESINIHKIHILMQNDFSTESFFWIAGFMRISEDTMEKLI